jgi:hypothetical protein
MLIRCQGYNSGAQEYLEEGNKAGREYTRNELDERVMLYGDLDLTRMIYESIPDNGQDRYLSFTMAFREDIVNADTLHNVTTEFKQFLMYAYKEDEFNFYAEAHLPKIKQIRDKKTGDLIERKPHIHIIIPRKNMLSGNEANPVGIYQSNERYFEAFQEYLNQKYNLASPREHVRIDPKDAASVLSRYKGDDFYGKNREFKQDLVKQVIANGVTSRADFYALVATHGETRIRNEGKPNEYIAVKLADDAKFTNLKDTIFQDDFIVRRELKKPPLDKKVIQARLLEWPQRAKEIKYVSKATPSFRQLYKQSSVAEKAQLLIEREQAFYQTHGEPYDSKLHTIERKGNHQRSADEAGAERPAQAAGGLQDVSVSDVADHRQTGSARGRDRAVLLPNDAQLHLGQSDPGGNPGLRSPVRAGRGRRSEPADGRSGRRSGVSEAAAGKSADTAVGSGSVAGSRRVRTPRTGVVIPLYARNPHRIPTIADIEARSQRLFDPLKRPIDSELVIALATAIDPGGAGPPDPPRTDPAPSAVEPKRQLKPRSSTSKTRNIPSYALNPHRAATISDVEAYSQRLFAPLKSTVDSELVIKLATNKPVAVNRSASTVAAYFNRQIEQNQLLPEQRRAVQRVDKQFHEVRRLVFSDERLTRQDKAQLVSVLIFERMKAREAIHTPLLHQEAIYMGSAEIRALIDKDEQEEAHPQFSISGPGPSHARPVRERIQRVISNLTWQVDEKAREERERELSSKDIYTKKARFSQNVHYLDKATDKTLFVDTGKSISLRRNGITEAGVAVALQLAQQRFGSTLTINGSAEFKRLVVEAAAKSDLDIHFTDTNMNQALMARRAELAIERDGLQIQSPDEAVQDGADVAPIQDQVSATAQRAAPVATDKTIVVGTLLDHGSAPYKHDDKNQGSYFVSLQTDTGPRTLWGTELQEVMQDQGFVLGEQITLNDGGKQPVTLQQPQEDGSVKETQLFRRSWSAEQDTTVREVPMVATTAESDPLPTAVDIEGRIEQAEASLEKLVSSSAPAALSATPIESSALVASEAGQQQTAVVEPVTIVHNGEPVKVDPANAGDVATYTRQLTTEVTVQSERIDSATQRISELVNMRDNHSADRGPEFVEQCNEGIAGAERSIEGSKAILADAQASLQKLDAPRIDVVRSVSPMDSPAPAIPSAAAPAKAAAEPITILHNSEPVTVDLANAGDVAKYTRQLTTEVDVQTQGIASATQRIGELVNMRDNHSESRGPEFIEQCNTEIAKAERSIEGSKAIIEQAETSLQKLGAATVEPELSTARVELPAVELSEPEEDQGPEMA